ncbi:hypothetical protein LTR36_007892 [Oleoguttula mirabilis]|uniref:Arrestin C-terminal-like domain-containing protein n=1 Tax=Oleoguttula mirabilis TaxID=1507867 RepID=A0AAV9JA34_9PEZI|nr:hypothetical protein LTR36_007892 [Oleoguttula mirabilis]
MPPAADRSPASLPSPGRRIISRIASPFTSKSRNFTDFFIEVDDPHKQHSPGDIVRGSVRLRVLKPIRVTHIAVCLHGFVQVYQNPGSPGEGSRANSGYFGTGRGQKSGEYFGNGFASLFEDEVVLCGDGRLGDGSYQFDFELEFPDRSLPSSIDFERGTISYMITATMTRPTTMSATTSCDRKVYYVERIDISCMKPPQPRTITLEPISRKSRAKHKARKMVVPGERRSRRGGSTQQSEQNRTSDASSAPAESGTPSSPAPSEASFDSLFSNSGRASQPDSYRHSPGGSESSKVNTSKSSLGDRTITATVESLSSGCLRGDSVGIKVTVNHTKPIKSLYGVIVTLYRQARVDMHPAIPLGPTEKGLASKYEDYYPKSITGLGGLSLSGAGSSHVFRKDLAQVMVPLYVDPNSLTAEVTARVRVPDEAFPTISTVPGSMISFKYHVEAVVDIQGRLGGHDRTLASLSLTGANPQLGEIAEGADQAAAFAPYGSAVVDTAPIRRDKGVITCTFEMIVGTRDSERRKGKRKVENAAEPEQRQSPLLGQPSSQSQVQAGATEQLTGHDPDGYWYGGAQHYHDQHWHQQYRHTESYGQPVGYDHVVYHSGYEQPPPAVPIPPLPDESQLSEKGRMQRAEGRLLPSHPPGMENASSGNAAVGATAPYLSDEYERPHDAARASRSTAPAYAVQPMSAANVVAQLPSSSSGEAPGHHLAAPEYEPPGPCLTSQDTVNPTGDKQELERQRLQVGASAPPEEAASPRENDEVEWQKSSEASDQPSAPTVDAVGASMPDNHDSHSDAAGSSGLPRYER